MVEQVAGIAGAVEGNREQASEDVQSPKPIRPEVIFELSSEQQKALLLLSSGEPIRVAAEAVGVNRGTVYRWMKSDPHFRAAYNAWQLEQRESCRTALHGCMMQAVKRIVERVRCDEGLAFKVVREMGIFKGPLAMNIDPGQVEQEIEIEQMQEEAELERRRLEQTMARPKALPEVKRTEPEEHLPQPQQGDTDAALARAAAQRVSRKKELDRVSVSIG